jgi:hypothetical protein
VITFGGSKFTLLFEGVFASKPVPVIVTGWFNVPSIGENEVMVGSGFASGGSNVTVAGCEGPFGVVTIT